jgi:hypothetical protein
LYVIKNIRNHTLGVDGVIINPGEQLTIQTITDPIAKAIEAGDLRIQSGDETREERHANVEALKPFKVGDPAIDGDA